MPEVIKPPPRPLADTRAASSSATGGALSGEPDDSDFASLLDDESPGTASAETAKKGGRASRADSANAATDTAEPAVVWLAAPLQPAPLPNPGEITAASVLSAGGLAAGPSLGEATDPTGALTAADGGAAAQTAGGPDTDPAMLLTEAAGTVPPTPASTTAGATTQAPLPSADDPSTPPDAQAATLLASTQAKTAQASSSEQPPPIPETLDSPAETRRAGRNAGRTTNAAANLQGQEGGKPDPAAQAGTGQAVRGGQRPPGSESAPQGLPMPTTGSFNSATPGGLDTLPTLPSQAASQYAAAATPEHPAGTAHSPAMAQLTAPLVRVAAAGGGAFQIDLTPAELGRIQVVADISNGQVTLSVQAEHADTLALLRRDMQQLEKALGDAGLKLDNANLQFSLQGDGQSRGFAAPDQRGNGPQGNGHASAVIAAIETTPEYTPRPIDGLVDVTI